MDIMGQYQESSKFAITVLPYILLPVPPQNECSTSMESIIFFYSNRRSVNILLHQDTPPQNFGTMILLLRSGSCETCKGLNCTLWPGHMWFACQSTGGSNMAGGTGRFPSFFCGREVFFGPGVVEDGCFQTTGIFQMKLRYHCYHYTCTSDGCTNLA